jgi:hypothetical protein
VETVSICLCAGFISESTEWSLNVSLLLSLSVKEYQWNRADSQVNKRAVSPESSVTGRSNTVTILFQFRHFYCFSSLLFQMFLLSFIIPIQTLFQKTVEKDTSV